MRYRLQWWVHHLVYNPECTQSDVYWFFLIVNALLAKKMKKREVILDGFFVQLRIFMLGELFPTFCPIQVILCLRDSENCKFCISAAHNSCDKLIQLHDKYIEWNKLLCGQFNNFIAAYVFVTDSPARGWERLMSKWVDHHLFADLQRPSVWNLKVLMVLNQGLFWWTRLHFIY